LLLIPYEDLLEQIEVELEKMARFAELPRERERLMKGTAKALEICS